MDNNGTKRRVIHLRGTNGVGKTTSVKCFLKNHKPVEREITLSNKKYCYCYCPDIDAVACGVYRGRSADGVDGYINKREILQEYILKIMVEVNPRYIIMDSLVYGKTFTFGAGLAAVAKKHGYEYVGLVLAPPLERAIEGVLKRNGGKEFNYENLLGTYNNVIVSSHKLKKAGLNIKFIDTSEISLEDMGNIIEQEL